MKIGTKLLFRGREVELLCRNSNVYWTDKIYARIHQETQDCYLDISEVRELLKEMELLAKGK
jgi:hypothetical protein